MKVKLYLVLMIFIFFSCFTDELEENHIVTGLKPVYGESPVSGKIEIQEPATFNSPGKIVFLPPLLFINELNKGFHVIDNSDPSNPQKIAFVSVPFNKDLAVKGQYIYANNDLDLISMRYIAKDSIEMIARIPDAFDGVPLLPENYRGYFECVDAAKGEVIGWESATLSNPRCRTW